MRHVPPMLDHGDVCRRRSRMMRMNRMHRIFHERAAITAMAIPVICKKIASEQCAWKVVRIEAREPMPQGMHALKEQPSAPSRCTIRLAERVDTFRITNQRWIEHMLEIRLDHSMIATGLKEFRATRKRLSYIGIRLKAGDPDGMCVDMTVTLHIFVQRSNYR